MRSARRWNGVFRTISLLLVCCGAVYVCAAFNSARAATDQAAVRPEPLIRLGPGDTVSMAVFEQPDMNATLYVGDDGTLPVALAGPVHVAGLTPAGAGEAIAKALRDGKFLVNPHVTITLVNAYNQRVSVLGEVAQPGRYSVDSRTTILDLLAQAGGAKESSADIAYLVRTNSDGTTTRQAIDLAGLRSGRGIENISALRGGDLLLVPAADQYYIYGEVAKTGEYRLDRNTTVLQAIVQAGGITLRGSMHRIEIRRKGPDGKRVSFKAKLGDQVRPGDEIRVKESIF